MDQQQQPAPERLAVLRIDGHLSLLLPASVANFVMLNAVEVVEQRHEDTLYHLAKGQPNMTVTPAKVNREGKVRPAAGSALDFPSAEVPYDPDA